jgi:hypothetical protein
LLLPLTISLPDSASFFGGIFRDRSDLQAKTVPLPNKKAQNFHPALSGFRVFPGFKASFPVRY